MPKASEVAQELRRVADALDKEPETDVRRPYLFFSCSGDKDVFLRTAALLPRPFKKVYEDTGESYDALRLEYDSPGLHLAASVYRSAVCILKTPARPATYECPPLLSEMEEASLV
jgi:hypothetical protein